MFHAGIFSLMKGYNHRVSIARSIENLNSGECLEVSERNFFYAFYQDINKLAEAIHIDNGGRKFETTEEVLDLFCKNTKCTYTKYIIYGEVKHIFKKD